MPDSTDVQLVGTVTSGEVGLPKPPNPCKFYLQAYLTYIHTCLYNDILPHNKGLDHLLWHQKSYPLSQAFSNKTEMLDVERPATVSIPSEG